MKLKIWKAPALLLILCLVAGVYAQQQVGWDACPSVSEADFTVEPIVTRDKDEAHSPIKIDFHVVEDPAAPNGSWTNFYFNELRGKVRYYNEATNSVTEVGEVEGFFSTQKDIFSGLVLHPNFENNRWMFLQYAMDGYFEMARYTITPDNQLDKTSKKLYFKYPKTNDDWHDASAMDFDAYGDMWIAVGDCQKYQETGLATNDLRASILRIHPDSSEKGYSIPTQATGDPTGNFGEYWSGKFAEMGEAALAAEYADTSKVKPEIYLKGVRNPYTLKVVHPTERWIVFGDVGPDFGGITDEFNLIQMPGFAGWAIWAGEDELGKYTGGVEVNHDGISGVPEFAGKGGASGLPPIIDAQYPVKQSSAMSGPIYWYDGSLQSDRKFPAYYHGKWFVADNNETAWDGPPWVKVLTMDPAYEQVASEEDFFGFTKERIQEIYFGPDGAMYIAYFYQPWFGDNAKNDIVRVSYKGTGNENCLPAELVPPFTTATAPVGPAALTPGLAINGRGEIRLSDWDGAAVKLYNASGNEIPLQHAGNGVFRMRGEAKAGIYFLKHGKSLHRISYLNF